MANNPPGTYYVNQAGSGAGDGSSAANARSVANHNADTWNGPSTIYLLDTLTTQVVVPSSGTDTDHIITYRGDYPAHPCTIDMGGAGTIALYINGKNYINASGLTIQNSTANLIKLNGTTNNINLSDITLGQGGAAQDIFINGGENITLDNFTHNQGVGYIVFTNNATTNISFTNFTVNGAAGKTPNYCFYLYQNTNLTFTGNTITDWTCQNATDKLIYVRNCTGGTFANNAIGTAGHGNSGYGYYCQAATSLTFTSDVVTAGAAYGWYMDANTTSTLTSCTAASCATLGFYNLNNTTYVSCIADGNDTGFSIAGGTSTATGCTSKNAINNGTGFLISNGSITLTSCISYDNEEDGFSANGTGTMTCNRCLSYSNGIVAQATSGDGFTAHDTSILNVYNSIAYNNRKSGIAITGTGNSNLYNNTCYNNYAAEKAGTGGGIYSSKTGGTINIKNNITANHDLEINIAAIAGVTYALDYNCYYDSMTGIDAFVFNGTGYANFAAYRAAHATQDVHSINENPDWVSVITPDFHLTIASPQQSRNGGVNVGLTTDYNGDVVPFGGGFPMGAYRGPALNSPMGLSPGLGGGGKIPPRRRRR